MHDNVVETERGWVDLTNLVYNGKFINWRESIGKIVDFKYNDIISTLTITGRADNVQYVYINIPGYAEHYKIYVGQIKHGQLGGALKIITPDYRYNVGDVVNDLKITGREKNSGYKYYNYQCLNDGYVGRIREDHLMTGHACPICNNSIGEKNVIKYLEEHQIDFIPQYTFDNCQYIKQLHFDFYLPNYNACVEFDGIHHYKPVDFAGKGMEWAKEQFEYVLLRDQIKNEYCKDNNIPLCRIKYTQDIKSVLDNFLSALTIQN